MMIMTSDRSAAIVQTDRGEQEMIAYLLVALVAALHLYFMYLEMVAWDTPTGRKAFNLTPEFSAASKTLAANQGLYNGFLAAGLIWALVAGAPVGYPAKIFFLVCVIIAGLYGAATVSRRILLVQSLPAAVALAAVLIAH
jgi:putative membrane protein